MKKIYLTEKKLQQIVTESVKTILNEIGDTPKGQFALGAVSGRAQGKYRTFSLPTAKKNKLQWLANDAGDESYYHYSKQDDYMKAHEMDDAFRQGSIYGWSKGAESLNENNESYNFVESVDIDELINNGQTSLGDFYIYNLSRQSDAILELIIDGPNGEGRAKIALQGDIEEDYRYALSIAYKNYLKQ